MWGMIGAILLQANGQDNHIGVLSSLYDSENSHLHGKLIGLILKSRLRTTKK